MKKSIFILALAAAAANAHAQVTLSGSSYTQNFDALSAGLPSGWTTYNNATATTLGTLEALTSTLPGLPFQIIPDTIECAGLVLGGGFKNYPSATVINEGINFCPPLPATAPTFTNRALGVRQVSPTNGTHPNLDPGAAFAVKIANTNGLTNFNLTFKLQSLDTSSTRTTRWRVDYGFGNTPTSFTAATATGTLTTGNKAFSNDTVTVNFGSALNNSSTPVWIRVAALTATSGSGNRPSSAIDDFKLSWTGTPSAVANVSAAPALSLTVLGEATTGKITFGYNVEEAGMYELAIYDLTGRIISRQAVNANGEQQLTVTGLALTPGMYIAKMSNGNSANVTRVSVQ